MRGDGFLFPNNRGFASVGILTDAPRRPFHRMPIFNLGPERPTRHAWRGLATDKPTDAYTHGVATPDVATKDTNEPTHRHGQMHPTVGNNGENISAIV